MEKSVNLEFSHLLAFRKKNWSDRNKIYQYLLLFAYPLGPILSILQDLFNYNFLSDQMIVITV